MIYTQSGCFLFLFQCIYIHTSHHNTQTAVIHCYALYRVGEVEVGQEVLKYLNRLIFIVEPGGLGGITARPTRQIITDLFIYVGECLS